jgi:hypothetical protein
MANERAARPRAPPFVDPLYRLVEQHYPEFVAAREATGRPLPRFRSAPSSASSLFVCGVATPRK